MCRSSLGVCASLAACVFFGIAPAQERKSPTIKGWGTVVDPDGDCKVRVDKGQMTLSAPMTWHDLTFSQDYTKSNAPRVLQKVSGDFRLTVKVGAFPLPGDVKSAGGSFSFVSSGLLVWQNDKNFIRMERAAVGTSPFVWVERFQESKSAFQKASPIPDRPTYIRVERKGNRFVFAHREPDDQMWTEVHTVEAELPPELQVGVMAINTASVAFSASLEDLDLIANKKSDEASQGKTVLKVKGYVVPSRQVTVSPKVSGQISQIFFEEGQQVKAGDILARLDPSEHEATLRVARAKLKLAEAVFAKAKKTGPDSELGVAQAGVEVAQAGVVLVQHRLESTVIRAPISGTVLLKHAEAGSLVSPTGFQLTAKICELADLRSLEVEVSVPENDLARIWKGQACTARLDSFPGAIYRGHVVRLSPSADRARGALPLRVRLDIPAGDDRLRPELAAIVQFRSKE
jgi:biotin carboxyl carrier protein